MKKWMFLFTLMLCLFCAPMTGFAAPTEEEKKQYEEAIADKWIEMLKGSIALDKSSADNKTYRLNWLLSENKPAEAKKLVVKIEKLEKENRRRRGDWTGFMKHRLTAI